MPIEGYAPGKIVVELTPEANAVVSPLIPDTLAGEVFTSFGVPLVDAALAFIPVQSITKLYGHVSLRCLMFDLMASRTSSTRDG
jgi:hypothetical protein